MVARVYYWRRCGINTELYSRGECFRLASDSVSHAHECFRSLLTCNLYYQFEKILVLNMPERSDKRDALSLAASLTNLKFDYLDGVVGKNIPQKALPVGQEQRNMQNSTLGSWRAHMNAIRG